ncbi:hypothetical protein [Paenibacillus odorifer]|uniref:hypothetical protein n=1 Tax=Paenibacillus odorifer TaxID=189426 RepID=UPI00096FF038|nr:hypothetical protein [Paenibacillus odorifer]OMD66674.1 hypothetical protein BSK50_30705 [Paenibacillus odorifer]
MISLNKVNKPVKVFEGVIDLNNKKGGQPCISKILPQATLYYASIPSDQFNENGSQIHEYIFKTQTEAISSGLPYNIATWNNLNSLADNGHHFSNMIINTPQGRFIWHEQLEENFDGELEMSSCMYRAYGAPEAFSEEIEEYLFSTYHDNGELLSVSCVNREGLQVYEATLSSDEDGTFIINTLGEFTHI